MGQMVCRADFLHAGQLAMYTPTILHVSCMGKIDNICPAGVLLQDMCSLYHISQVFRICEGHIPTPE